MAINRVTVGIQGTSSWDVSSYVVSANIVLGKNRILDTFEPGTLSVVVKNYGREFDPTNTSSAFYGSTTPKRNFVRVTMAGYGIFYGVIDNWSFDYSVSGEATASFSASEYSSFFVNQNIMASSFPAELSGARVTRVLDDDGVAYSTATGARVIGTGTQMLDADPAPAGQNAFTYLRQIETSEQGQFYFNSDGSLYFDDNSYQLNSNGVELFTDDGATNTSYPGTAVASYPYNFIEVSYSSDLLYNHISVQTADETKTAISDDSNSQSLYSRIEYTVDGVLYSSSQKLSNLGSLLIKKYSEPVYRINSLRVNFAGLPTATQDRLAWKGNSVNFFAKVRFTPNGIGSAIERYVRVIGIEHEISPGSHDILFKFDNITVQYLVLDDSEFGKLDYYSLGL